MYKSASTAYITKLIVSGVNKIQYGATLEARRRILTEYNIIAPFAAMAERMAFDSHTRAALHPESRFVKL